MTDEVRLNELQLIEGDAVDLAALKAADVHCTATMKRAKVIRPVRSAQAVTVRGIGVTKGARAAIEAAGGKVED